MATTTSARLGWIEACRGLAATAVVGYFTAVCMVFSGQSRFHFALMPSVALYAAWTVTEQWRV
jgi:hypothetical protein